MLITRRGKLFSFFIHNKWRNHAFKKGLNICHIWGYFYSLRNDFWWGSFSRELFSSAAIQQCLKRRVVLFGHSSLESLIQTQVLCNLPIHNWRNFRIFSVFMVKLIWSYWKLNYKNVRIYYLKLLWLIVYHDKHLDYAKAENIGFI